MALWMLLLELLKARRLANFEGVWPEMFAAWAAGFTIYLAAVALVGLLLSPLISRRGRALSATERPLLAVTLAGALTWFVLLLCQGEVNPVLALGVLLSFRCLPCLCGGPPEFLVFPCQRA